MMHPIITRSADCKDCYRCLRACPVKAISVKNGKTEIREESCILCGRCVQECPQHAKLIQNAINQVQDYLDSGQKVVLSLAPSFPAHFVDKDIDDLFSQIKSAGFYRVEETAIGAIYTVEEYKKLFETEKERVIISTCCPVIVNFVEKYYPDLVPSLAGVISPMAAHGLSIKERYGWSTKVVFAGPCIAKMTEKGMKGKVDAVLTFDQLQQFLETSKKTEGKFEKHNNVTHLETRLFPLSGGALRNLVQEYSYDLRLETITGLDECRDTLEAIKKGKLKYRFIELLACKEGCINGPAINQNIGLLERRQCVLEFYHRYFKEKEIKVFPVTQSLLKRHFTGMEDFKEEISEDIILNILAQIGKYTKEDEKNCGGCGYRTCREKAVAVYHGYAELEMCLSYMKAKAQSVADTIVNSTPNGIIVFDNKLIIKEINPAAQKMFNLFSIKAGDSLRDYSDCEYLIKVIRTGISKMDYIVNYPELDLTTRQIVVPIEKSKDKLFMTIITDITENEKKRREMEEMKEEIFSKANHVINNQMLVAQQIAGLLGETTAETKSTLLELIRHFNDNKIVRESR